MHNNDEEPRFSQDPKQLPALEAVSVAKSIEASVDGIQNISSKLEPSPHVSETVVEETLCQSVSEALSQSFSATPGYLANRWNHVNLFSTPVAAPSTMFITPTMYVIYKLDYK